MHRNTVFFLSLILTTFLLSPQGAGYTFQTAGKHEVLILLEDLPGFPTEVQAQLLLIESRSPGSMLMEELKKGGFFREKDPKSIEIHRVGKTPFLSVRFPARPPFAAFKSSLLTAMGLSIQRARNLIFEATQKKQKTALQARLMEQERLQKARDTFLHEMELLGDTLDFGSALSLLRQNLGEVQARLKAALQEKVYLKKLEEEEEKEVVTSRTVDSSLETEIKRQLQKRETALREFRLRYTDDFPEVINVMEEIGKLKKKLSLAGENPLFVETMVKNPRLSHIQKLQLDMEITIHSLRAQSKVLEEEWEKKKEIAPRFYALQEKGEALRRALLDEKEEIRRIQKELEEMERLRGKSCSPICITG